MASGAEGREGGGGGAPDPWDRPDNPADPAMSALPGHEKKSYLIPLSLGIGLVGLAVFTFLAMPRGSRPPTLVLNNPDLGFSAEGIRVGPPLSNMHGVLSGVPRPFSSALEQGERDA